MPDNHQECVAIIRCKDEMVRYPAVFMDNLNEPPTRLIRPVWSYHFLFFWRVTIEMEHGPTSVKFARMPE